MKRLLYVKNTAILKSDRMSIRDAAQAKSAKENDKAPSNGIWAAVRTAAELHAALPNLGGTVGNAELVASPGKLLEVLRMNSAKTPAPLRTERSAKDR
jgi:hypothetical protein